jgi:hypothetical protein
MSSFGQTATVNLDWDGSDIFSPGCVPSSLAFACGNNSGLLSLGSWNDGTKTFLDPIPAGKILTNISITGFLGDGSGAGGLLIVAELNGATIDAPKLPSFQNCGTITANGTFPSTNFSGLVSAGSYNYGSNNSIRFNVTTTNGNTLCLDKAVVVLTYADAITFSNIPATTTINCDELLPASPTAMNGLRQCNSS